MVIGHVVEDSGKCADAEWIMVGDGDVVLRGLLACQPGNVPGKFHAGMTSSRT